MWPLSKEILALTIWGRGLDIPIVVTMLLLLLVVIRCLQLHNYKLLLNVQWNLL